MPIDTTVDGNPGSVQSAADWLRGTLARDVGRSVETLQSAADETTAHWAGRAASAFRTRMAGASAKAGALHDDARSIADTFSRFADGLAVAQSRMAQARDIAVAGGLRVAGLLILEPGAAPSASVLGGGAAALAEYQRKVVAYQAAGAEVTAARAELAANTEVLTASYTELAGRPIIEMDDLTGASGELAVIAAAVTNALQDVGAALNEAARKDGGVAGGALGGAAGGIAEGLPGGSGADAAGKPPEQPANNGENAAKTPEPAAGGGVGGAVADILRGLTG
ncbi:MULTISPECIES: hypothetical protein [Actinoplanes]|uniref:hypothetical protein n=1 Tax=Actinoplanes TaxID=1865 RepID=UPI0005F283EA|nr:MULTISPECIES: hypothetical protein [Actinoplanes]GLY00224.1 hypothetical protein Acsp01_06030 [Actinoplanes sp. NBRC 101535]